MQIEIKMDEAYKEPKVLILTDKMSDEVGEILRKLSETMPRMLAGFRGDTLEILEQARISRIYAQSGKIFARTETSEYELRLRLYELEDRLDKSCFVRISNSEIINLRKVKNFDLSYSGTIRVNMLDGTAAYVSRRNVAKIKEVLGI